PAEHGRLHGEPVVEKEVGPVQRDGAARLLLDVARLVDVIEVRVGVDDPLYGEAVVAHDLEDALMLAARIDDHRLFGLGAGQDRAIALKRTDGKGLEQHHYGLVAWNAPESMVRRVWPPRDSTRPENEPLVALASAVKV